MSQEQNRQVVIVGLDKACYHLVEGQIKGLPIAEFKSSEELVEVFESFSDGNVGLILCGTEHGLDLAHEVAQIMRSQCPTTKSFLVTNQKEGFSPKVHKKNGFSEAFLLPIDRDLMDQQIATVLAKLRSGERVYRTIKSVDLQGDTTVPFDCYLYLPMNGRYLKYLSANRRIEKEKVDKVGQYKFRQMHIDVKDVDKFYDYTAEQLLNTGAGNDGVSATEKEERMVQSVRELLTNLLDQSLKADFESGREYMTNLRNIVAKVVAPNSKGNWYGDLLRSVGGAHGEYSHCTDVSAFAALFAVGLGHPNPENLAIAGFLHDLGMVDFPVETRLKPQDQWTEEEWALYKAHPQASVNMIRTKKMVVDEKIEKAILQHHERFDGKGFPKGLSGDRITYEAQILSFANQFQRALEVKEGEPLLSPLQAAEKVARTGSISPEVCRRILHLFTSQT